MTTTTEATQRAADLAEQLADVGARFVVAADELAAIAAELAALEGQHRAATNQAGAPCRRPPARELAVEVLHGRLAALRPYLPHVTTAAADRAAEQLAHPPCGAGSVASFAETGGVHVVRP